MNCNKLCNNPISRYKEGRYPENMEKFNIVNTSPFESEVSFCFQNDANATTYLLDPPNMKLKPGEAQVRFLTVILESLKFF